MGYERFFSTRGEDRIVRQLCTPPKRGIFVDVGAGPPCDGNNTVHFERSGWAGLCIDAHPKVIENLKRERKCLIEHCAVGKDRGDVKFFISGDTNLSSKLPGRPCIGEITVPGKPLEDVLRKHGIWKIDLLSIDAEGCDLEVWRSMDWASHRPTTVIIEPGSDRWDIMAELTNSHSAYQYRLVAETEDNLIFKTEFEWWPTEEDEWVFGVKIRGAVRKTLGEVCYDILPEDPRGGWRFRTNCLDVDYAGVAGSRETAMQSVEMALEEIRD